MDKRRNYDKIIAEIATLLKVQGKRLDKIVEAINSQEKRIGGLEGKWTGIVMSACVVTTLISIAIALISILK